MNQVKK